MDLGVHPTVFVLPNVTTLNKINLLSLLFFPLKKNYCCKFNWTISWLFVRASEPRL